MLSHMSVALSASTTIALSTTVVALSASTIALSIITVNHDTRSAPTVSMVMMMIGEHLLVGHRLLSLHVLIETQLLAHGASAGMGQIPFKGTHGAPSIPTHGDKLGTHPFVGSDHDRFHF